MYFIYYFLHELKNVINYYEIPYIRKRIYSGWDPTLKL